MRRRSIDICQQSRGPHHETVHHLNPLIPAAVRVEAGRKDSFYQRYDIECVTCVQEARRPVQATAPRWLKNGSTWLEHNGTLRKTCVGAAQRPERKGGNMLGVPVSVCARIRREGTTRTTKASHGAGASRSSSNTIRLTADNVNEMAPASEKSVSGARLTWRLVNQHNLI